MKPSQTGQEERVSLRSAPAGRLNCWIHVRGAEKGSGPKRGLLKLHWGSGGVAADVDAK